jgi:hypothetical protein
MMSYQEMAETAVARTKASDESAKAAQRDKRAQSLAAMGLVSREGSRYYVKSATMRGREESHEVWRDENGRVRCSCAEFERQSPDDAAFRCEHILAVRYSLAANSESAAPAAATTGQSTAPDAEPMEREVSDGQDEKEEAVMQDYLVETTRNQLEMAEIAELESKQPAPAFTNLLHTLRRPIDARLIKTREGWTDRHGITHLVEYIEWHTVADILDRVSPNWSHAVRNITQIGDLVAVTAAITIDGVTREGVGTGAAESETGIKKAEHDALKRAAVKFGVARDLYQRESEVTEEDGIAPAIQRDPRPKTLNDLITPKQLWMIRSLGREAGCDVEQECQSMLQCGLEEISKRAASSFIDYLKRKQQENPPEELRRAS